MPPEDLEREDKYTVSTEFHVPDLTPLGRCVESETFDLVATYYDTESSHLQRRRITMRRRTGGHDAGWHVKLPAGEARTEVHVDDTSMTPPDEIIALLTGVRGAQPLIPVVRLHTRRTTHAVHRSDGGDPMVVEVADDVVTSLRLLPPERSLSWREVEVELGPGGRESDLAIAAGLLRNAGARPSTSPSKLGTAMGGPTPLPEPEGLPGRITAYVRTQVDVLADGDLGLRRGEDTVYPMRVAVRRLRSTLHTFGGQLDRHEAERLERELARLAGSLGDVRDHDVLARRFHALADELNDQGDRLHKTARRAARHVEEQREHARRRLMKVLRKPRYLALVADLDRWHRRPPFAPRSDDEPTTADPYVDAARAQVSRRLTAAARDDATDHELHQLRKSYKRLRYALELALDDLGSDAVDELAHARQMQDVLGDHQDSVVAIDTIVRASQATSGGDSASTDIDGMDDLGKLEHKRAKATRDAAREAVQALAGVES